MINLLTSSYISGVICLQFLNEETVTIFAPNSGDVLSCSLEQWTGLCDLENQVPSDLRAKLTSLGLHI